MARRKPRLIEHVRIVDIGHKGYSVGKTEEGETVFVQEAVPGDVVHALVTKKRKGSSFCKVETYLSYSAFRKEADCAHFGTCGGCKWQHMQYSSQLDFKHKSVVDALRRIGHLPNTPVAPILGCENPYAYRNKMEYTCTDRSWLTEEQIAADGFVAQPGMGLHVSGAFAHVTNIEHCLLQEEPANAIRNFVRDFALEHDFTFQNIRQHSGLMRNLIIRNNTDGQFMVTVVFGEDDVHARELLLPALQDQFPCITALFYCINTKPNDSVTDQEFVHVAGDTFLRMRLGHITYRLGPKSFFQTNSVQAEVMCQVVREMADLQPHMTLYDLYCGIGSFSLYLARDVRQVVGVEYVPEAIEDAILNAGYNNIGNTAFYAGDVKELLKDEGIHALGRPDVIVTDPPRAGMDPKVITSLLEIAAERIVYVSCNPATQARDLEALAGMYEVVRCQPIDMFPQTAHVENVALLTKRKTDA